MGPRFEEISSTAESLARLEQELLKKLPLSVQMLIICRLTKAQRFPPNTQIKFFRYVPANKDVAEEEPFIVCVERPNMHSKKGIILLTPENPTHEMIATFDSFIGWEEPQLFHCVQPPFWKALEEMCTRHGNTHANKNKGIPGIMLAILDPEKTKEMEVPAEIDGFPKICFGELSESDVPTVISTWKWAASHSERQMKECVKTLTSCGVFVGEGGGEDSWELASHAVLSPIGSLNMLYTPDKFKRRGLAKLAMTWLSKEVVTKLGIHPMAEVEVWNDPSKTLMEKVGYKEVFKTRWFYFQPKDILI